jgi:hypothetical protein
VLADPQVAGLGGVDTDSISIEPRTSVGKGVSVGTDVSIAMGVSVVVGGDAPQAASNSRATAIGSSTTERFSPLILLLPPVMQNLFRAYVHV